jgi:predicted type IV restriction endonuclease
MVMAMRQTLEDIRKKLTEHVYKNEEHVRLSLVARLLSKLGWDIWNPNEVNTEFYAVPGEDSSRVDIALFQTSYTPSVYIEVKAVGKLQGDLRLFETQLRDYNRNNTAVFTILTDGQQWRFYYSQIGGEFSRKCFKILDFISDDIDELEVSFRSFLSRSEVDNGNAKRNAERYLQMSQKQRVMEDMFPQAEKMIKEPPFPSLPQALVELVSSAGFEISIEEAAQFIQEFSVRKSTPEPIIIPPKNTEPIISRYIPNFKGDRVTQDEIKFNIIKILQKNNGRAHNRDVLNEIYKIFEYQFNKQYYKELVPKGKPNGEPRWRNKTRWAREDLKQIGIIKKPGDSGHGYWELTERGRNWSG